MRKIIVGLLIIGSTANVLAVNNSLFQQFDDQYNIGYGISQTSLQNGVGPGAQTNNQFLNLEIERLFDIGVWMDVNANIVTGTYTNQNPNSVGGGFPTNTTNQNPNMGGVNVKVGYAFPFANQHLQITPYALAGRNTNLAQSTLVDNNFQNITADYYYTGGLGARLEYRINNIVNLYADQSVVYNWDQSGPLYGIQPQNNMIYTSTIGAKFNVYKAFQVGVSAFYSNYQMMAQVPIVQFGPLYVPTAAVGGLLTLGLTY